MKRTVSMLTVLCLVLALFSFSAAAEGELQHEYSTAANSGIRHEVCTTLNGTSASDYYTGEYTYSSLSALSGDSLLKALCSLMTDTHTYASTYNDCRDLAVITDCENGDGTSINLLYSSYSVTWQEWCNNTPGGWNREHVWPQSLGGFKTSGAGSDLHHVRPSDQTLNSIRGNLLYGNASGGTAVYGSSIVENTLGGTRQGNYFEPVDDVKGDVARIILYVYVRYGSTNSKCASITNVFQSVDVLLEWCALDPVDTWEMGRNEVVGAIQGNRNVFIDYPELAWLIFDRDIPTDMTTPSGEAASYVPCPHTNTTVKNAAAATCAEGGYSGDTYCTDCGRLLSSGAATPTTDDHSYGSWTVTQEATATADGQRQRVCAVCGKAQTETLPATGEPETTAPTTEPTAPPTEPAQTEPATEPVTQPATQPDTQPTSAPTTAPATEATAPSGGTSDDAPSFPWAIVIVILAVGAVVLIVVSKKR